MSDKPKTLFFIEPKSAEAQERIGTYLADRQVAGSNWREGVEDTEGKLHDGWDGLDLKTARLIRTMERQDTRVLVGYWEREDTAGARLKSAKFIVITALGLKTRRTAVYKKAIAKIPKRASA
ncbi:MAG: hypothetical protein E6R14_06850 [Thermomicrobiales bacterium]|nr:MAG: hypothetical protein E6R14_06850 [Thermomicrobiales bacterium]